MRPSRFQESPVIGSLEHTLFFHLLKGPNEYKIAHSAFYVHAEESSDPMII